MTNHEIASQLRRHAGELAKTGNNLYRVRAFRQAAMAVLSLDRTVNELGPDGLKTVPGIGASLAETISRFAETGSWEPRTRPRQMT